MPHAAITDWVICSEPFVAKTFKPRRVAADRPLLPTKRDKKNKALAKRLVCHFLRLFASGSRFGLGGSRTAALGTCMWESDGSAVLT